MVFSPFFHCAISGEKDLKTCEKWCITIFRNQHHFSTLEDFGLGGAYYSSVGIARGRGIVPKPNTMKPAVADLVFPFACHDTQELSAGWVAFC